ncbi:MAG: neutral/alkaline non-lysosomal ceramidase N-terminal domain-containing protein [Candidatus Latescibacteria bacterium]|nr:neutral/alkaline non-lysosomal ceramidase N-terminal domain-containing protein [Candidatus Latescibacterota bacterium]
MKTSWKIFHYLLYVVIISMILISVMTFNTSVSYATGWKAGVSSVIITPDKPVWMAGYGNRDKPSEGKIHDIHVKALAFEDPDGNRAVIVTADLISVMLDFSNRVAKTIENRYGLPRENILFNTSHTHCGPESRLPLLFYIPVEKGGRIEEYVQWLETKYVEAVSAAITDLKPAQIQFTSINPVPFAVSRRLPSPEGILYRSGPSSYYTGGLRDDTVPVLSVKSADGTIRAILFGYACHPITLNIYKFCGDYPGFAQQYIEEAYPGATALFVQGCAGQLVPNARFQLEYAMGHGRALADAVTKALEGEQMPVTGHIAGAYEEVICDHEPLPDRKVFEGNLNSKNVVERRQAAYFLKKMDNNEPINESVPCPLQVLRLGDEVLLVGLFGEPVVEYAVRFKSENLTYKFIWVAGYCNDGLGYLPTWQIQREGGYEGGDAMRHMPFTGPYTETVEKRVVDGVRKLVENVSE